MMALEEGNSGVSRMFVWVVARRWVAAKGEVRGALVFVGVPPPLIYERRYSPGLGQENLCIYVHINV